MTDQKLPRREREKLQQRREMLAAALDLFSQKGYHNVSIQEIAEKAEFAIGTLINFSRAKRTSTRPWSWNDAAISKRPSWPMAQPEDEAEKLRNYIRTKVNILPQSALRSPVSVRKPGSQL